MGTQLVWIRGEGDKVEIGRFQRAEDHFLVSWNGGPELRLSRQPDTVIVVEEGSLRFEALTKAAATAAMFAATPAELIKAVLEDVGTAMTAEQVQEVLRRDLALDPKRVKAGWATAAELLRQDPQVRYDPRPELPTFTWSPQEHEPDPYADLRHRPWRFLATELGDRELSPDELAELRKRIADEPPTEVAAALVLAAMELAEWPSPGTVRAATTDRRRVAELTLLPERAVKRLRAEAGARGQREVLWFLAALQRSSKALAGLAAELAPVDVDDPGPAAVLECLTTRLNARAGKPLTNTVIAEILDRIPPCPGARAREFFQDLRSQLKDPVLRGKLATRPELGPVPLEAPERPEPAPDERPVPEPGSARPVEAPVVQATVVEAPVVAAPVLAAPVAGPPVAAPAVVEPVVEPPAPEPAVAPQPVPAASPAALSADEELEAVEDRQALGRVLLAVRPPDRELSADSLALALLRVAGSDPVLSEALELLRE